MQEKQIYNINIDSHELLITPNDLKKDIPLKETDIQNVFKGREIIKSILRGDDKRLIVVVGPCSIHDVKAAKEYALKLKNLAEELKDNLFIIMRVYFEKPRTTVGWKGLINDPHLDGSFKINEGFKIGRQLLVDLVKMGLPLGTEALDPISPQYMQDAMVWTAIGARTTESQTHREMSSGLSTAIGFKNGTDGGIKVATNAMESASHPHSFLGVNQKGQVAIIKTKGNKYGHIVLRGGGGKPNYDSVHVSLCETELEKANLPTNIMVDCSHANSNKDPALQPLVLQNISEQIQNGNKSIIGIMLESNINWGNQKVVNGLKDLKYGVSVTDSCIDWKTTEKSLRDLSNELSNYLIKR